jgi:plastocyanin
MLVSRRSLAAAPLLVALLALAAPACRISSRTDADSVGDAAREERKAAIEATAEPQADPPVAGAPTVTINAPGEASKFEPKRATADAGVTNIHFTTDGAHNFSLTGPGHLIGILWGFKDGAPTDVTHSLKLVPGTYDYVCTIHKSTMTGTLVVS